jgi:hypothetical protein
VNSTFIVARSYCTRVFEVDSIGPFTVQRIVVFGTSGDAVRLPDGRLLSAEKGIS